MKKILSVFFIFMIAAVSSAADLKSIKLEIPEELSQDSPLIIKLSNIPKGYRFHGYFLYAFHPYVPAGLEKGDDVYVRKNKKVQWTCYIFGPAKKDRLTYIKGKDMRKRNFVLQYKTTNWPAGDYQAGLQLSFLNQKNKAVRIKKQILVSIIEKEETGK